MAPAERNSPEQPILRDRARGVVSCDQAFEQLYALYAPVVLGWLSLRVEATEVDDLFQDVWTVFYGRWRRWQFLLEMMAPEARPVLSFLFRTCHFVLQGHRRRAAHVQEPLEAVEVPDGARGPDRLLQCAEFGRCLALARKICSHEELDVLMAKLAGVPAREIARTLSMTEAVVDHQFRNAVARLQKRLRVEGARRERRKNAQAQR